jgi:hypothetical protein
VGIAGVVKKIVPVLCKIVELPEVVFDWKVHAWSIYPLQMFSLLEGTM